MEQWEYLPTYIKAEIDNKELREFLQGQFPERKKLPRYAAESMMPQMNHLGRQGWELVHMEPVADVGRKGDVLFDSSGSTWSNVYFCVFKRRRPAATSSHSPGASAQAAPSAPASIPTPPTILPPGLDDER